jgi:RNA polymerase sigma-70 factor (ECF subfamily)
VTDETPDEVLATRAAAGDAQAFGTLYGRYRKMVYTLALRTLGTDADAEDALQDTFLRVHRALPKFRGDSKLSTWIWRVALSVSLSSRRSRRRAPAPADDAGAAEAPDPGPSSEDAAAARDEAAMLRRHLEELPRRDRAILHLRYHEEKSFEEISDLLGLPVGTAKSLVFRAKAELRRNMERDGHAL